MKPRFSLKLLLMAVTATAAACYWVCRPGQIADRLIAAVEAGDDAAADAMFTEARHARFSRWSRWRRHEKLDGRLDLELEKLPRTWADVVAGRCRVNVTADFRGGGLITAAIRGELDVRIGRVTGDYEDGLLLVSGLKIGSHVFRQHYSENPPVRTVADPARPIEAMLSPPMDRTDPSRTPTRYDLLVAPTSQSASSP